MNYLLSKNTPWDIIYSYLHDNKCSIYIFYYAFFPYWLQPALESET